MDNLLTIQQAADILDLHPETLRRWDKDGKLVAVKVGGRGDRKYKYEDVLKAKIGIGATRYKDFDIVPYSPGFEHAPGLIRIASFIIQKEGLVAVFAFSDGGPFLRMSHPHVNDDYLLKEAMEMIHHYIDNNRAKHLEEYTFEFYPTNFLPVDKPRWWIRRLRDIYKDELDVYAK